ncbi:ABC transporter ATP-binding protein [Streptomyces sp. ATCC 21386]|uniref:ABC transporter ATP-binding protein n=1 Tax=Streptomyces sp. ATCC 21386 TaxID=2699428 RepID=UPI001BFEF77C|nr:ABC transporter ATP-binding protein [Streptomyces sp. ATCC 21386]
MTTTAAVPEDQARAPEPESRAGATETPDRRAALLTLLRPHRPRLAGAIACGLLDQALTLAAALLGARLVGEALSGAAPGDLTTSLWLLGALVVPKVLAAWAESYLAHDLAFRVLAELRDRCYRALADLTPGYLLRRRSGDIGATAMADIELLELFFAHSLSPLIVAASVPAACLIAAFVLDPLIGAALLPAIVLMATVPFWLRRRSADQGRRMREATGEAAAETVDAVQGLAETLVFARQDTQAERLRAATERLGHATRAHRSRGGVEKAAGDAIAAVGLIAVLLTALALVNSGTLTADRVPTAAVLGAFAFLPLMTLVDTWRELANIRAAANRLAEIVTARPDVTDQSSRIRPVPEPIDPTVVFEGVRFRYGPDLPDAVDQVTFTVPAGSTVALAGHSGAGKTTCASLLLRHWDPTAGTVRVGGHDLRTLPLDRLRRLIAAVPQETYLFNLSIRDNIRLARPDATDTEVEEAARAAHAHDFVAALPDGYDTPAGEGGAHLSGGQRQRIAIARALLTGAPVLVLDEAVSNLDAESEAGVDRALRAARTSRTTLIVAHRPSTLRTADTVVLLDGGRILDAGPHDTLLARSPAYRRLLNESARQVS